MTQRIPSGERICVRFPDANGNDLFLITTKQTTDLYYLYEVNGKGLIKLGKDPNPINLEKKFRVIECVKEANLGVAQPQ